MLRSRHTESVNSETSTGKVDSYYMATLIFDMLHRNQH